jgi:hypothetical protein
MRRRLEELNWGTQPHSLDNEEHGEAVRVFDSKLGEVVVSSAISLAHQVKKAG